MGNDQSISQVDKSTDSQQQGQTKQTGIVIVGEKQENLSSGIESDKFITRLQTCPTFQPIFNPSNADAKPQPGDFVQPLDWKSALKVCKRFQDHLRSCAETVSADQNSLTVQIKQVDATSHHIMQKYTERQKAFAKYAEHTRKIEQVSTSLKRVRMNLEQTLSLLDELNSMLPENEKLEPF